MSGTTDIVFFSILIFLSVVILITNIFTVFVFWIHRNRLKRTFLLVINLTVADLLVGLTGILMVGEFAFLRHIGFNEINDKSYFGILLCHQSAFACASVHFLELISIERAFALIWPLRHRVTSKNAYIYSVVIVWLTGTVQGALSLLAISEVINSVYSEVSGGVLIYFSLGTICVSYLSIRKRLKKENPAINIAQNRQSMEQNIKLSRTFFTVIGVSIIFWAPSVSFYIVSSFRPALFTGFLKYMFIALNQCNSLVNPIIYSFRMPIFRKTLKQLKKRMSIPKRSEKYTVSRETSNMYDTRHL